MVQNGLTRVRNGACLGRVSVTDHAVTRWRQRVNCLAEPPVKLSANKIRRRISSAIKNALKRFENLVYAGEDGNLQIYRALKSSDFEAFLIVYLVDERTVVTILAEWMEIYHAPVVKELRDLCPLHFSG